MAKADYSRFTVRRIRDRLSREKDAVTLPIVRGLRFSNPSAAQVLILPCLADPVVGILADEHGIPRENMRAGERDYWVWRKMHRRPYLRGVRLPPRPRSLGEDIDFVRSELAGRKLDLVYLDFFGQPTSETFTILSKLFRYDMLARKAVVLITTLFTRSKNEQSDFNKDVRVAVSKRGPKSKEAKRAFKALTGQYITAAAIFTKYRRPTKLVPHTYKSLERKTGMTRTCVLTEARWS